MSTKNPLLFVVEDNAIYNQLLEEKLLSFGYTNIKTFLNASDFLENLDKNPDVILLDYHLGDTNGFELLKLIKQKRVKAQIIFLSGNDDNVVTMDALTSGAFAYIIKDQFAFENLQKKLKAFEGFWI